MSTEAERPRNIALAITGASGAIYGVRTLAALLAAGCDVDLVITEYGRRLLRDELGDDASVERLPEFMRQRYGDTVGRGRYVLHANKDLGAKLASGSQGCEAMGLHSLSSVVLFAEKMYLQGEDGRRIDLGFVGEVKNVNARLLQLLVQGEGAGDQPGGRRACGSEQIWINPERS